MSNDKFCALVEKVLDTWQGTPEELGETLEEALAVIDVFGGTWEEQHHKRKLLLANKMQARKKILACQGGKELIYAEERERFGY
jgi:hypothetical protein